VPDHVNDIELWLKRHQDALEQLVRETRLGVDVVGFIALLVLTGHSDEEIYEEIGAYLVSPDGQRNPLQHAPEAIAAIRGLAGET